MKDQIAYSGSMVAQSALVLFLVVAIPLWDRYEIPRLKASTEPDKKVRFYRKVVAVEWILAAASCSMAGFRAIFMIRTTPTDLAWLSGEKGISFLIGLGVAMTVALVLQIGLALWSEKARQKMGKALQSLSYLLPFSSRERSWWWLVCITAGVCEEVVYRGFLLHYFHAMPFQLSLMWAMLISSVIFGIAHLYQGVKGAAATVVLGFALGTVFFITGSLLIPIVAHAILDLRVLALVPRSQTSAEPGEARL